MEKERKVELEEGAVLEIGRGYVTVRVKVTKSTAPYESLSVEYGATVPLLFSEGEVKEALVRARELVIEQMTKDIDEIRGAVV